MINIINLIINIINNILLLYYILSIPRIAILNLIYCATFCFLNFYSVFAIILWSYLRSSFRKNNFFLRN